MMRFPRAEPGDELTAEMLNLIYDALDRGIPVVPPLLVGAQGEISLGEEPGFWIQLTGAPSGTAHPWQQVMPRPAGTWVEGPRSGTTSAEPAYDVNGNTLALTGKRVRAWRDRTSNTLLFHYSTCT